MDYEDLKDRFTYYPPTGPGEAGKYEDIRDLGLRMAELVDVLCPDSREKSLAITKLEESVFWAIASIARERRNVPDPGPKPG